LALKLKDRGASEAFLYVQSNLSIKT